MDVCPTSAWTSWPMSRRLSSEGSGRSAKRLLETEHTLLTACGASQIFIGIEATKEARPSVEKIFCWQEIEAVPEGEGTWQQTP